MKNLYKYRYTIVFIISFGLAFLLSNSYRNYIYYNNINDFGLADAGANMVIVIVLLSSFWMFGIKPSNNKVRDLIYVTTFYILAEIASFFIPLFGTYDLTDIIGYLTGALIGFYILKFLDKDEITTFFISIKQ